MQPALTMRKNFFIEVVIGGIVIGSGVGTSKRMAAQSAARDALQRLETGGWSEEMYLALEAQNEIAAEPETDEADVEEISSEAS